MDESNKIKRPRDVFNALSVHQSTDEFDGLWKEIIRQRDENIERQRQLENERAEMLSHFDRRENELAQQASKMRKDFEVRENQLEMRMRKQEEALIAERDGLRQHIDKMQSQSRLRDFEFDKRKRELAKELEKFEDDKKRYDEDNNKKLQTISATFVNKVVVDLKLRETSFSKISFWWAIAGGVSLTIGLAFAAYAVYQTSLNISVNVPLSLLLYQTIKGALFVTISGILARYSFLLSRRYLDESLQVSDVIHNVSFGQLYIQSYGASAGWEQVKDAFAKWHHTKADSTEEENERSDKVKLDVSQITDLLEAVKELKY